MMKANEYSRFFRLTCQVVKYFLLCLLGFAIACLLAAILGSLETAAPVLFWVWELLVRLAVIILGLVAIAVVVESLRH